MQRMLSLLRRTLTDLVMAIEGTIIMSDDLKEVLDNMFKNIGVFMRAILAF